ncbi:MAG TPA: glutamate--tRNA ligase, partial [Acidimicrobiia bacterium]|nr:glutamate--tRNA ligase [Acidimicrobiia bacterium]
HGGTFILRIEDTDAARSRAEWVQGIQDALRWLGLDWDEGPILQSERFDRYHAAADGLLADGHAYECYCTEEEVKARNEAARAAGRTPGYDGHCRDLTPDQRAALTAEDRPRSIRFRTPDDGVSTFDDAIRGEVSVEWANIPDFVIVRSDGTPLFFLANAVDDAEMGITHVIRGEDLLDTTHRVLALRSALGAADPPTYAHLPLIVGADRAKLSKRHGAVALEDFRDQGYLPEAVMNYLALLGWAPGGEGGEKDGREVLDAGELITEFDLVRVTHAAAAFDHQKLDWMNGEWIRRLPLDELERRARPLAEARYGHRLDDDAFRGALAIGQERAVTVASLVDQMDFLFVDDADFEIAPESWEKVAGTDRAGEILDAVIAHLEGCDWALDAIDLRPVLDGLGLKPRKAMPALYAAVEGRHAGLPLFDSIQLLGRDRALARLRAARKRITDR